MSVKELQEKKYFIIFEALLKGIQLEFKNDWFLFYSGGQIYQTHYSKARGEQVTHKSVVTLQSFLQFFEEVSNDKLKRVWANIKLSNLHDKLTKE